MNSCAQSVLASNFKTAGEQRKIWRCQPICDGSGVAGRRNSYQRFGERNAATVTLINSRSDETWLPEWSGKSEHYRFSRHGLKNGHAVARRTVWNISTARTSLDGHHAVFPKDLVLPCIQASTRKNDLVLDPFCGTGTVGRICGALVRRFVGIELNPRFARAAVKSLGQDTNWLQSVRRVERD